MWISLAVVLVVFLALDLGVFNRRPHRIGFREALLSTALSVLAALVFCAWIYLAKGHQAGVEFLTGYVVEESLSIDNILVFLVLFRALDVAEENQHKVLFAGIIGALILRAAFVAGGVSLLQHFEKIIYLFGAFLLFAGFQMLFSRGREVSYDRNWMVRLARRWFPFTPQQTGKGFFARVEGKWMGTPLLLALIAVEASDILFAVDSVPAVLAVTRDPFIVYSSNLFAILGLRALYFTIAGFLPRVYYLQTGIAATLMFVGLKMIASEHIRLSSQVSLAVVAGIMAVTVVASLMRAKRRRGIGRRQG
jgi:tellurite resistance protein TerC